LKDSEATQNGGNIENNEGHCMTSRIIIHELLHVLGFLHEHTRSDRDQFIKVLHQNIEGCKCIFYSGFCLSHEVCHRNLYLIALLYSLL